MTYKNIIVTFFILLITTVFFTSCNEKNSVQKEELPSPIQQVKPVVQKPIKKQEVVVVKKQIEVVKQQIKQQNIDKKEPKKLIVKKPKKIDKVEISVKSYPKKVLKKKSSIATKKTIENFDFDIIKKGYKDNNTLLIVGGIQGDEPGGFMAASLISTHYTIKKGSVWVIPNLNFYSIIKRSRGPYGDMNRKFANLPKNDPEYETIQRIKSYIKHKDVKLVVNLHDGSGFYRPKYIDKQHSPYKWGQCSIIDQEEIKNNKYSNLADISKKVVSHVNKYLIKKEDIYHLHNTRTVEGDKEMEKTLTYYAINKGKAAFGNEASKSLPTHQRIYYHLLALEKYMDIMGIEYERKFDLKESIVKNIIDNDIEISLYDNKIKLPLAQIRNILKYFPVKKDGTIDFIPSNPLMSIVKKEHEYTIYYGNRRLARLKADYINHDNVKKDVKLNVDSKDKKINFGSIINVKKDFMVYPLKDYRINVIGYTNKSKKETDVLINYEKMLKNFSIDKKGLIYRIEFYTKDKFAGMILVDFTG